VKYSQWVRARFEKWWTDCGMESFNKLTGGKGRHFASLIGKPLARNSFEDGAVVEHDRVVRVLFAIAATLKNERESAMLRRITSELNRDDAVQLPPDKDTSHVEFKQRSLLMKWLQENGHA